MKYVFGYIQMWKLIAKKHSYMEIGRTLVLFFPWETSIRLFLQFLSLPSPSQGCVDTSLVVREERAFSVCSNASWNFLPLLVLGRMRRRARFSNLPILDSFVVSLTHPSSVHAGGKTIGFHSFSQLFSLLHCWWLKRGWREMESLGADGWRNEKPAPAFFAEWDPGRETPRHTGNQKQPGFCACRLAGLRSFSYGKWGAAARLWNSFRRELLILCLGHLLQGGD